MNKKLEEIKDLAVDIFAHNRKDWNITMSSGNEVYSNYAANVINDVIKILGIEIDGAEIDIRVRELEDLYE